MERSVLTAENFLQVPLSIQVPACSSSLPSKTAFHTSGSERLRFNDSYQLIGNEVRERETYQSVRNIREVSKLMRLIRSGGLRFSFPTDFSLAMPYRAVPLRRCRVLLKLQAVIGFGLRIEAVYIANSSDGERPSVFPRKHLSAVHYMYVVD